MERRELKRPLQLLLLCDYRKEGAATVRDHIDAIVQYSQHQIRLLSIFGDLPSGLDLTRFDGAIIHYSIVACSDAYLSPSARQRLGAWRGLKIAFIQDEYRHVNRTVDALKQIGVDVLFTCVPEDQIDKVYNPGQLPNVRKVNTLTGFVPAHLLQKEVAKFSERPLDVAYRARQVPAWLGELGQEKWRIAERFLRDAPCYGLKCDVSYREEDRLYGQEWVALLCRSKATLGVESGASVFDFSGRIELNVNAHVLREPAVSFERLRELYFPLEEGRIRLNQISPRFFEAAALRTLMILYVGNYSGILVPWRHYIPLAKDHSNVDEVVAVLRDPERASRIIDNAYQDVALNPAYSYQAFVAKLDATIREAFASSQARTNPSYDDEAFAIASRLPPSDRFKRICRNAMDRIHRFVFKTMLGQLPPHYRDMTKLALRRLYGIVRPVSRQIKVLIKHYS